MDVPSVKTGLATLYCYYYYYGVKITVLPYYFCLALV